MNPILKTIKVIDNTSTGAVLRARRLDKGLSLRSTAKRIGVSAAYLSDLELGHRKWSQIKIDSFINALKNE